MATNLDLSMINKVVSFNLYPASILGNSRDLVKIVAILDATSAQAIADVQQMHINVYPTIPLAERPANDFRSYSYLKILLPNGQVEVIGIPWIDGPITVLVNNTINVVVSNVGAADVALIRKALIANGYNDVVLTLV